MVTGRIELALSVLLGDDGPVIASSCWRSRTPRSDLAKILVRWARAGAFAQSEKVPRRLLCSQADADTDHHSLPSRSTGGCPNGTPRPSRAWLDQLVRDDRPSGSTET